MLEIIRYRILMLRLRSEIAATVRESREANSALRSHGNGLKTACKACESIV